MSVVNTIINKINSCALIVRKYNLGDKAYFIDTFKDIDMSLKDCAWGLGEKKIQNKEIIKDASSIEIQDEQSAQNRFDSFEKNSNKIYAYLKSNFDVKELKLREENIERRFRHLLAKKYLQLEVSNIFEIEEKRKMPFKEKFAIFVANNLFLILIIGVIGYFTAPRIIDGFTPVDTLTERIHEKSKYKFSGAICNDSWTSHSQGQGTCSHHDGVNYYFDKDDYSKSIEQCREEAIRISWLAP
jgi:hypothetical protein